MHSELKKNCDQPCQESRPNYLSFFYLGSITNLLSSEETAQQYGAKKQRNKKYYRTM